MEVRERSPSQPPSLSLPSSSTGDPANRCERPRCPFETKVEEEMKEHRREKHRIFDCNQCGENRSSDDGLRLHIKEAHNVSSGKGKIDSIVDRLSCKPKENKITSTVGFMKLDVESVDEQTTAENPAKAKKRKLSDRLQDPIKVKAADRSKAANVNSFRTKTLTLNHKASAMQREVGTEPDFVILMKNNLQNPKSSNASASAGKYLVFGEGPD